MRPLSLVPALCLALLTTPALAQAPGATATPMPGPTPPSAEAPSPSPMPSPPEAPPETSAPSPEMPMYRHHRHGMSMGGMMGRAPAVHIQSGDTVLDLQCSFRDSADACADAALKILKHLSGDESGDDGDGSGSGTDTGGDVVQ